MQNQGLFAIAFLQVAALLVLLVLYMLLYRDLPARFFRFWIAGWAVTTVSGAALVLGLFGVLPRGGMLAVGLALAAPPLFLASVFDYTGRSSRTTAAWPLALAGLLVLFWVDLYFEITHSAPWVAVGLKAAICCTAGFLLFRFAQGRRGWSSRLLGLTFFLNALHDLDRPLWAGQQFYLGRPALGAFLEAALGVAFAVVVLETARSRAEELNDKLRRLTLVAAASTQSFDVDEILNVVLRGLTESLGATHGLVRLLAGEGEARELIVRSAVGFSSSFLERYSRESVNEFWARRALDPGTSYLVLDAERDPHVRGRLEAEGIKAMVLVRLPGKDAPLGVLCVGSNAPRRFHSEEIHFVVNVANLLGLTIQNVSLFEQAAQAERQWMYTFDSIEDPILVHDPGFCIVRANQALRQRLGCHSADSLIGRSVSEVFRPLSSSSTNRSPNSPWMNCPYCEGMAGKGDKLDPTLGACFLASSSEFTGLGGVRLGTIHVLKDITERRRAEERYRNLIANVQEGVFISTPSGQFLDFNDAFMRMLGYEEREELLQTRIGPRIYVNPADRERLKKLLREHGSVTDFEFQMRRRDGEIRTVLESSFATRDAAGSIVAFQGFVLDITERKNAEQEIRRRNRELMVLNSISQTLNQSFPLDELLDRSLRQIVELFNVDLGMIYLLDEPTNTLRRMAAYGLRSEYAAHFPPTPFPADLLNQIRTMRATVLADLSLPWPETIRDFQQKEGVEVSNVVILWSKERILGTLVVSCRSRREFSSAELNLLTSVGSQVAASIEKSLMFEDTRQALENLRRTQEQLLQSEKMAAVGQLISGVAHELNNPLTAILGYSQLLATSGHVDGRGADFVEKLRTQALRTHRIV
ncbi:MAG: PAS domain S-box protein, partial [Acidobacteria bacterium]|nr:PAS domain S-box protein [Acidobacteriota bacterium]